MKNNMLKFTLLLMITICGFSSCKKIDVDQNFTSFGKVNFDASNLAINNTGEGRLLQIKSENGFKIEWRLDGIVSAPIGKRHFLFYDQRTNEVLAEKTIDVNIDKTEKWQLFQPSVGDNISFIDPNIDSEEPNASNNQIKIKFANYASNALPYNQLDVVIWAEGQPQGDIPLDTIKNVGKSFEGMSFHTVANSKKDMSIYFSFIESSSQKEVLRVNGSRYTTKGRATTLALSLIDAKKGNYVIYITHANIYDEPGTGSRIAGNNNRWYTVKYNILSYY